MPSTKLWRVLTPAQLNEGAMRLELLNALRRMGTKVKQDFQKTTETWETKVAFKEKVSLAGAKPTLEVTTDSDVYRFVNDGTAPHGIATRTAGQLAFEGTYTPKTTPGVIGSKSGGKSGEMRYAYQVWHPGTEGRKFDKAIAAKWRKDFRKEMDTSMTKVKLASGNPL